MKIKNIPLIIISITLLTFISCEDKRHSKNYNSQNDNNEEADYSGDGYWYGVD